MSPPHKSSVSSSAKGAKPQTRARVACSHCRARKVRCDGDRLGLPCTNCRMDKLECQLYCTKKQARKPYPSVTQPRPVQLVRLLPKYIQPIPSHIADADLRYFWLKGALNLPSTDACKLWDSYFQLVHPNLPILDRDRIMPCLSTGNGRHTISLLLFHCVMLVAQIFLDAYDNRCTNPAALQIMFDRARVLFDLGWETDRLTLLQSAILLSHYPTTTSTASKGPDYWISQAVSFAYALGLHRDPAETSRSPRDRSLRKQLWWSLYIRERLLHLDWGLPWIIWESAYDVPMLGPEDFESASLWPSDEDCSRHCTSQHTIDDQRLLVMTLIEKAKIARIIGRLVPISMGDSESIEHERQAKWLCRPIGAPTLRQVKAIMRDLYRWVRELPLEVICIQAGTPTTQRTVRSIMLDLNCSLLFCLYYLVTYHLTSLRWLQLATPSGTAPEDAIKALWAATRPIIHAVDRLMDDKLLGCFQLIGPSLIRPLLLCKILNNQAPPWMYPVLEIERIPLLVEEIGKNDRFFTWARSFPHIGILKDDPSNCNTSTSEACEVDVAGLCASLMGPNIFDVVLSELASPSAGSEYSVSI
ncbi:fungal-specific transcription factor domain-containing protein [Aspergillus pseudoustus]|uniref:Fungal-specific transcription factor domain-containing protein n=1 Tax=Aspergillus pseudoustus TaxID=1810923 RepID=A0ABR4K2D7_9EURO